MSLTRLWLCLAVGLPVLGSILGAMSTVDLTYQLRAGAEILANGAIPTRDAWTFTVAGLPWVDQQWLAQLTLASAYDMGGWTGLVLLRAGLTTLIFGALVAALRQAGLSARTTCFLVAAVFVVASPAMALRPQLFGMACFALVLWFLAGRRERQRRIWVIPVVIAIWANLHGSFILGPLLVGLGWLESLHDRDPYSRRLVLVGALSIVGASLTPFGPGVWGYAVGLTTNGLVTSRITEWQPTSMRDTAGLLFFASALGVAVLLARRSQSVPWPTLAWLGAFFLIGVYALRGVAWWPLAAAVATAGNLIPASPDRIGAQTPTLRRLNAAVAAALVATGIVFLPAWRPLDIDIGTPVATLTDAPPGVTAAVRDASQPGDRLLVPQSWGSWFEWALPDRLVAIDSRTEIFPAEVWLDVEGVVGGTEGWQERLRSWDVALVVTQKGEVAFAARLRAAGWVEMHQDEDGAVFGPPPAE